MPFGFRFASKMCEAVRVSQISSGLQGFWVHRHSCDPSNLSAVTCAGCFHQEEKEITELETISLFIFFFHSCLFTKTIHKFLFPPTQRTGDSFRMWCSWLLLLFQVLSKENSLAFSLLHLCWGQTTNLSCWLFTAFHIWLCNVPGCMLHIYIFPSKYVHKLLCMKSAHADPLRSHGSTPSHPYLLLMFWTVAPMSIYCGMNEAVSYITPYKKSVWACEKPYLITVNLITKLYYDLILLRLPCLQGPGFRTALKDLLKSVAKECISEVFKNY